MEGIRFRGRGRFKALASLGVSAVLHAALEEGRPKKEEVIPQAHDNHHFYADWSSDQIDRGKKEAEEGNPFHFHRNDEKEHDLEVRCQSRNSQEQREIQKEISAGCAKNEGGGNTEEHAKQVVGVQAEGPPVSLQHVTDPPGKDEVEEDPERAHGVRNKNPAEEPPDLSLEDRSAVEREDIGIFWHQGDENKNEGIQRHDVADESGDGEASEVFFQAVQSGHFKQVSIWSEGRDVKC